MASEMETKHNEDAVDAVPNSNLSPVSVDVAEAKHVRTPKRIMKTSPMLLPPSPEPTPPHALLDRVELYSSHRDSGKPRRSASHRVSHSRTQAAIVVSLDNFEKLPHGKRALNSPRSLKACEAESVNPSDLLPREFTDFMGPNVPENLARMRFMLFEKRRKEKLQRVSACREKMPEEVKENKKSSEELKDATAANGASVPMYAESPSRGGSYAFGMSPAPRAMSRSSSPPYHAGRTRSSSPFGRFSWYARDCRSPSVGAMMIYSRVISEHRLLSLKEILSLERIAERELRAEEVRERVALERKIREKILIDRELEKSRHMMDKMVQKEIQRSLLLRSRQMQWREQLIKIHENQVRESVTRREHAMSVPGRSDAEKRSPRPQSPESRIIRKKRPQTASAEAGAAPFVNAADAPRELKAAP